jgi:hypothetical protein
MVRMLEWRLREAKQTTQSHTASDSSRAAFGTDSSSCSEIPNPLLKFRMSTWVGEVKQLQWSQGLLSLVEITLAF